MELKDALLKTFAKAMQTPNEKETKFHYATVVDIQGSGDDKKVFVHLDGSEEGTRTPVVEGTKVMVDDRVLVTIENHKATIMSNVTSPATGRTDTTYMDLTNDGLIIGELGSTSNTYRVLIRPGGIDLKHGSDVLSTYSGSSLTFYIPGSNPLTAAATINSNGLNISKGSITLGSYFSVSNTGWMTCIGGKIGGWNITSSYLDSYTLNGAASDSTNGDKRVVLANGTSGNQDVLVVSHKVNGSWTWPVVLRADAYFSLSYGGQSLVFNPAATNPLSITGYISTTGGNIGGWTISSNGMFYPSATAPNAWIQSTGAAFGSGNYNVWIGRIDGPSTSYSYGIEGYHEVALTIGNGVTWLQLGCNGEWLRPNESGTCSLGNSDYKWTRVYATNGTIQTSDRKDKDVLGDLDEELATNLILNANPITYMWKDGDHRRTRMGFIAQEIAEECKAMNKNLALCTASFKGDPAFSDSGSDIARDYFGEDVDDEELTWGLSYSELIAPLVKVVQMQHDDIQNLINRVTDLEVQLNG